ncbi:aminodeoxychorismate synthase component I [Gracilimonas mengyeensis]|uniref:aminodeoxychorismate synthase component I n=1 Tax=Gracilimonas mengyeensis TaxID=1302730 RepID=UPI001FE64A0E|nr:aminodeoxychorismate synthase component I [Gracilimonas mengyeensis]
MRNLRSEGPVIFLDSQMQGHPASSKSYIAARPKRWIKSIDDGIEIYEGDQVRQEKGNPWGLLSRFWQKSWLFGYLGYDLKNHLEKLSSKNKAEVDVPDLYFMEPELILELEEDGEAKTIKGKVPEIKSSENISGEFHIKLETQISEHEYKAKIKRAQQDITEGEYYEINLSHPLVFEVTGDSLDLYQAMKQVGPVPFGAFLQLDDVSVCCASPERFLARKGQRVWSQPIKGTASRAGHSASDPAIETLLNSEKERAENLMIVDLVRNDLGRVALKNSVQVSDLFEIQTFETVHQMVSTVECTVSQQANSFDVIKACFPMGSMTGAPKIAAMKAIEELESYRRGIYSGAIGYIQPNGDFDFNVVIRSAIREGRKLVYPTGGAITSDSDPEAEWEETLVKAQALTRILNNMESAE